jgi:Flp pilus assembly protein TadD
LNEGLLVQNAEVTSIKIEKKGKYPYFHKQGKKLMMKAKFYDHRKGIRHPSLTVSMCLILLFLLPACSGKNRAANLYSDNMAKLDAIQAQPDTEKSLENLAPDKLLQEGKRYLELGNPGIAKLHFAMALKKKPMSAEAFFGLGKAFLLEGEMQKAKEVFNQALVVDPGHRASLLAIAKICRGESKYDEALTFFNKAVTLYPKDPEILTELAITYDGAGKEHEAEPLYLKVVELIPQQASAYNNLGFNYLLQKKYVQAITAFNHARQLEYTPNQRTLNNLAMAYIHNGEDVKAVNLLKQTVGKAGAYNNLGYIYMLQGQCDRAKKAFQNALDLNPLYYIRANSNLERLGTSDCPSSSDKAAPGGSGPEVSSHTVHVIPSGTGDISLLSESIQVSTPTPVDKPAMMEFASIPALPQGENPAETDMVRGGKMKTVSVTTGNFRDGPSLEASVLGFLVRGEKVTVLKQKNDWCFVKLRDGRLGWAHESLFVSTTTDASSENRHATAVLSLNPSKPLCRG